MRQIKYHDYAPVPSAWYYKAPEELADPSLVGYGADVYSWASVVYEVSYLIVATRCLHFSPELCRFSLARDRITAFAMFAAFCVSCRMDIAAY